MILKRYISVLLFVLALIGLSQHQVNVPNQEIVVQFSDVEVSSDEAQNTIETVQQKLHELGISDIQIYNENDSKLKITYYSKLDAAIIKGLLSTEHSIELNKSSNNQDHQDSSDYNLDVFEIYKSNNDNVDFEGVVLDIKSESDRFQNPKKYKSSSLIDSKEDNLPEKTSTGNNHGIAIAIDNTSYNFPEVRAGPLS